MARLFSALMAVVLLGGWATADEAKAPTGVWTKTTDEGLTIQFDFSKKDTLIVTNSVESSEMVITCKLTAGKDGTWTAKATKIENKDFPVELSDKFEFSFKLKVAKDKATVSDFTANEHEDQAKAVVEGEYKAKEAK